MITIAITKYHVCQEFVTNFLSSFSPGDSLSLACDEETVVTLSTAGATASTAEVARLSSFSDIL